VVSIEAEKEEKKKEIKVLEETKSTYSSEAEKFEE